MTTTPHADDVDPDHSPQRRPDGAAAALAWLAQPVTLAALAVLAVNDHVLKAAFPGPLTGKLSDFTGLIVAPPLVAVVALLLLPRLPSTPTAAWSTAAVGVGFVISKITVAGATFASALWGVVRPGSVILADPTDLIAVPALAMAWYLWARARQRPVAGRTAAAVRILVVLPAAAIAVGATSQVHTNVAVDVVELRGHVVLGEAWVTPDRVDGELAAVRSVAHSVDGRTWVKSTGGMTGLEISSHDPTPTSCDPSDPHDCYRVMPGRLAIEHRTGDGPWTIAWQVPTRDRAKLVDQYESFTNDLVECRSILVHSVDSGYVVIAACGRDGFVRRDVAGEWQRIGFPPRDPAIDPAALGGPSPLTPMPIEIAVVAASLALALGLDQLAPQAPYRLAKTMLVALSLILWVPAFLVRVGLFADFLILAEMVIQPVLGFAYLSLHFRQRTLRLPVLVSAVATGLAAGAIPLLVHQGYLVESWWKYPAAAAIAVAGIGVTVTLGIANRIGQTTTTSDGPPGAASTAIPHSDT